MTDLLDKVTNGNCLDVLKSLPPESVDLVLTDPPYGISFQSNMSKDKNYRSRLKTVDGIANDGKDNTPFLSDVIDELSRVMKPNTHIYWFTRWDRLPMQLPLLEKHFKLKNAIIWDKGNGGMGDLTGAYSNRYEVIIFAQKGRRPLNKVDGKSRHDDIFKFPKISPVKLRHSHEKPEALIKFLMDKSSNKGDIVLDPFCGSGTTAAVAKKNRRHFITTEVDAELTQIAKDRLEEAN